MRLVKSFLRGSFLSGCFIGSVVFLTGAAAVWAADRAAPKSRPAVFAPIDYAGICDVYGDGFFFFPGTHRCLKIGSLADRTWPALSPFSTVAAGPRSAVGDAADFDSGFLQFVGLAAGSARAVFDFDADTKGYLRGPNATAPLLASTATFGKRYSTILPLQDQAGQRAAVDSIAANDKIVSTRAAVADIGNLTLDQPWGAALSGAAHQIQGSLYGPAGNLAAPASSTGDFGYAVQGGLEFNTNMIAPGDKLWLQAAYEKSPDARVGGNHTPSHDGTGVSPQDYNFGWNPQLPSDCVYTGLTAVTAQCDRPWGFAFTGALKRYWTPTLSSAVFGSELSTDYDAAALAGLGSAVGVRDAKGTRIGGSLVWTPIKGLDIGTEFMYLHLSQSTPAGLAPNYGATSLGTSSAPAFKNNSNEPAPKANSNEYEGRIRVQQAF